MIEEKHPHEIHASILLPDAFDEQARERIQNLMDGVLTSLKGITAEKKGNTLTATANFPQNIQPIINVAIWECLASIVEHSRENILKFGDQENPAKIRVFYRDGDPKDQTEKPTVIEKGGYKVNSGTPTVYDYQNKTSRMVTKDDDNPVMRIVAERNGETHVWQNPTSRKEWITHSAKEYEQKDLETSSPSVAFAIPPNFLEKQKHPLDILLGKFHELLQSLTVEISENSVVLESENITLDKQRDQTTKPIHQKLLAPKEIDYFLNTVIEKVLAIMVQQASPNAEKSKKTGIVEVLVDADYAKQMVKIPNLNATVLIQYTFKNASFTQEEERYILRYNYNGEQNTKYVDKKNVQKIEKKDGNVCILMNPEKESTLEIGGGITKMGHVTFENATYTMNSGICRIVYTNGSSTNIFKKYMTQVTGDNGESVWRKDLENPRK